MWLQPVTLEGRFIRLEPLTFAHTAALWGVSDDPAIYRFKPYRMASQDDMRTFVTRAQSNLAMDEGMGFVTIDRTSGDPVGSSSYFAADALHRRLEIGGTWVIPARQRTPINTEAKYLMLRYAFETLECIRVEFKTDALNETSRRAIARIGAREEGTLRHHMICADGRFRDSVYFSVIESEWPGVKEALERKLQR